MKIKLYLIAVLLVCACLSGCRNPWMEKIVGPLMKSKDGVTYTVTFDSNDGSSVPSKTVASGSKISKPADPTKPDYTFGNWYKDSDLITIWNFAGDTVTGNITLYASWISGTTTYTVTFNSNGGSSVDQQTVAYGSTITAPTTPTLANSIFGAWYKESSLNNVWNFATDTVSSNITLFAEWIPNVFDYSPHNGGIVISSYSGSGTSVTIPEWINGLPVLAIGNSVFFGVSLTTIKIGADVELGPDAFTPSFMTAYENNGYAKGTYSRANPMVDDWTWSPP